MKLKKCLGVLLTCSILMCGLGLEAGAVGSGDTCVLTLSALVYEPLENYQKYGAVPTTTRATSQFDIQVPGKSVVASGTSFSLETGETVTINASYSPRYASMDFGLIDEDGLFHYINTTSGSINKTIQVDEQGSYTFAVRNNSSGTASVAGFVNY